MFSCDSPLTLSQTPCGSGSQVDMLDKSSACVIALSMREVDAGQLGAAAAVPLVIAMLHYEVECNNKVGARRQAVSPKS